MANKSAGEPSEPLKYQTWILKVSLHCEGCKRKVKKVLQSIDGVFTTAFDSQQHKVTVTGNVTVETLIRKLLKTGKHAEIWPENIAGKEKKSGRAKNKDKDSDPDSENGINDNDQKDENPCEKVEDKLSSVKNSGKESGGNSPGNTPACGESPAVDQKGSESTEGAAKGGGKKKKRNGEKGNNGSSPGSGAQSHDLGWKHGVGPMNLNPTRQSSSHYPQGNYPQVQVQPVHVASYNRINPIPSQSFGPSCTVPSCAGTHQEIYPVQATPLDSFQIFSDENANGCSIM